MLNCDDDAYIAARAIQFFTPGVPQVYYVGLLAGKNDEEGIKNSGEGREINRHNFSMGEIDQAVKKDVVQRLLTLIRFRNDYPAFNGSFTVVDSELDEVHLSWQKDDHRCTLKIDLNNYQSVIEHIDNRGKLVVYVV
jgi:sucrose phosphorylase